LIFNLFGFFFEAKLCIQLISNSVLPVSASQVLRGREEGREGQKKEERKERRKKGRKEGRKA
jgi:hypothetical protein